MILMIADTNFYQTGHRKHTTILHIKNHQMMQLNQTPL